MSPNQDQARLYPMQRPWQYANFIVGWWCWFCVIASIIGSLFLPLIFEWARKVIPAWRKMMAGEARSYLRLSADGLEYRNWPLFEIRCRWEDVAALRQSRWLGAALYLHRAEITGFLEFSLNLNPLQIHLSSLEGWAQGSLSEDLRHYAPHLFDEPA